VTQLRASSNSRIISQSRMQSMVQSMWSDSIDIFSLTSIWIARMLLVPFPWSRRLWALPFLTVLALAQRANAARGTRHKTTMDWPIQMTKVVTRLLGRRPWVLDCSDVVESYCEPRQQYRADALYVRRGQHGRAVPERRKRWKASQRN